MDLWLFYGGTFDPVHNGHLEVARNARDAIGCEVRLMPAADPPHRAPPGADAHHRTRMLELALDGEPGLCIDRRELERPGRSYTADTLRALRAEIGDEVPVALLVGADSFLGLPTWRDWRALLGLAHFVVAERPGNVLDASLPAELAMAIEGRVATRVEELAEAPGGRVYRLRQPLHPESASAIRRAIRDGDEWASRVPAAVAVYIRRNRLYRAEPEPATPGSPDGAAQRV